MFPSISFYSILLAITSSMAYADLWTSKEGKSFQADLIGQNEQKLTFKTPSGITIICALSDLNEASQKKITQKDSKTSRSPAFSYTPMLSDSFKQSEIESIDIYESENPFSNSKVKGQIYRGKQLTVFLKKQLIDKIDEHQAKTLMNDIYVVYDGLRRINRELGLFNELLAGEFEYDNKGRSTQLASFKDKTSHPIFNLFAYNAANKKSNSKEITKVLVEDTLTKNNLKAEWIQQGLRLYLNEYFDFLKRPTSLQAKLPPKTQLKKITIPSLSKILAPNTIKTIYTANEQLFCKYLLFYCLHMQGSTGFHQVKQYIDKKCQNMSDILPQGMSEAELKKTLNKAYEPYGINFSFEKKQPYIPYIVP